MIRLVASDIDGTLIGESNTISPNNLEAIHTIQNTSVHFTICTGKTYSMAKNLCQELQANYGIFGNGNQIIDLKTGKEIYRKILEPKDVSYCINLAKEKNLHVHVYTENEVISSQLLYLDLRNFLLKDSALYHSNLQFKIVSDIFKHIEENHLEIFKLIISSTSDLSSLKNIIESSTDLTICRIQKCKEYKDTVIDKEYEYLDITPKGTNKNDALTILEKYLSLSSKETLAIGDNLNDMDMIKNSGIRHCCC